MSQMEKEPIDFLKLFNDEQKRITEEAEAENKRCQRLLKEAVVRLAEIDKDIAARKATCGKLRQEYGLIFEQRRKATQERLQVENVSEEDLRSGKMSAMEYFGRGQSAAKIEKAAQEAARSGMGKIAKALRDMGRGIRALEAERFTNLSEQAYLQTCAINLCLRLGKASIETNEKSVAAVNAAQANFATLANDMKSRLAVGNDSAINGFVYSDITAADLRDLALSGEIPESMIDDLQKIIDDLGDFPGRISLAVDPGNAFGQPRGFRVWGDHEAPNRFNVPVQRAPWDPKAMITTMEMGNEQHIDCPSA